jgi:2-polyprenyl-6-methoxyphenol hydroxylase-like FAD-dependent oxidoreductase
MTPSQSDTLESQCCIAGGGPAGIMLGYLLARAGVDVVVLEKHSDFLRDFRGDTIHPSTMEIMHELGLLESFLQRPHNRMHQARIQFGDKLYKVADFSGLKAKCPYIAFMPQWEFLDFIATAAARYPNFKLRMDAEAVGLVEEDGKVVGVGINTASGQEVMRPALIVGADGRHSVLRQASGLNVQNIGAIMDALWMRIDKKGAAMEAAFARMSPGRILITIDRGDYWQCAFILPKGHYQQLQKQGIEEFRNSIAAIAPELKDHLHSLRDWDDISLLSVRVDRLQQWWRTGLLFIGDAAHAMSPVGGVGINLAIQDAVAAANALVPAFHAGHIDNSVLAAVQTRREPPTRTTQKMQVLIQNQILRKVLGGANVAPWPIKLLNAISVLRRLPARAIGLGVQPEHVEISEYFNDQGKDQATSYEIL